MGDYGNAQTLHVFRLFGAQESQLGQRIELSFVKGTQYLPGSYT
jgi:hypothetical protein